MAERLVLMETRYFLRADYFFFVFGQVRLNHPPPPDTQTPPGYARVALVLTSYYLAETNWKARWERRNKKGI